MISYFSIENNRINRKLSEDAATDWLQVTQPTADEIRKLSKRFQLPADYLTAVLDDAENSRAEGLQQTDFSRPALLLLQFPDLSESESGYQLFATYPLSLIMTPGKKLISVSNHEPKFLAELFTKELPVNDMSPEWNLVCQILWSIVLTYNLDLKIIEGQVEDLEAKIQVSTENKHLYQIMQIQKSLVLFEAATSANLRTLTKLGNTEKFLKNHAFRNHLHDILVETEQSMTTSRINLKLVSQMTDIFSAVVSNNLNNVMKILTSLTIVLTIPTIIGGLYGMNVKLPFADKDNAFFVIMFWTVLICVLTVRYLRKKNLL